MDKLIEAIAPFFLLLLIIGAFSIAVFIIMLAISKTLREEFMRDLRRK
jgi:hypothetical protein